MQEDNLSAVSRFSPRFCGLDIICLQEFKGKDAGREGFLAGMGARGYDYVAFGEQVRGRGAGGADSCPQDHV
jgi:exonuclease III